MARNAAPATVVTLILLLVVPAHFVLETEAFCYFLPTDALCNKIKAAAVAAAKAAAAKAEAAAKATEAGAKAFAATLNSTTASLTKQLAALEKGINSGASATEAAIQARVSSFEASLADFSKWLDNINLTLTKADNARSGKAAAGPWVASMELRSPLLVLKSSIAGLQTSLDALKRDLRLAAGEVSSEGGSRGGSSAGSVSASAAGVRATLARQQLVLRMTVVRQRAAAVDAALSDFAARV
ncbi:hypothetical protein CLOM_g6780 [Closterium sp. NIES-68]|nr:hypothetical protein CLOM_g20688 [Closterium sp. NIES-68]GJP31730.1 hypothetical protein CLOM_g14800 [Closterium sp. NIES-68]GJP47600.1 hypothetical protein CLOM_g6780 [Closterium sp. NIES-68]GJP83098.1 hypothetical protein CLOP_g13301 [Closterium sp. NIES-67]